MINKLLLLVLLSPLLTSAQNNLARFENDTLITSSGYKIYEGQVLHFANGTAAAGYFTYVSFHKSMARNDSYSLQQCSVTVSKLRNFNYANADNYSIRVIGTASCLNDRKLEVDLILNFNKIMESVGGVNAELTVPVEYRSKRVEPVVPTVKNQTRAEDKKAVAVPDDLKKLLIADEIKKLFDLYKAGALTKTEYEQQKKKLLEQ